MSTNQSRINPAILNFFLRKRQQQGAWNERLPDNESVGDAVNRIASYAGDEPKTGGWRDFIQNAPPVQPVINRSMSPMSRVAEMPVTDTLPRNYNAETGDMPDIINPMPPPGGSLRETRPRTVTPNIINAAQNYQSGVFQQSVKPVDSKGQDLPVRLTGSPPTPQIIAAAQNATPPDVITRPPATAISQIFDAARADSPPIQPQPTFDASQQPRIAAQPTTDERGVLIDGTGQPLPLPDSMKDTSHESRARITDPSQFLINRAIGSLTDQPNYGIGKDGLPRTHAARGFGGRLKAFLKEEGRGIEEGRGVLGAVPRAIHAAANPDIVAQDRLREQQRENYQAAASDIGLQGAQAKVQQEQAAADYMRQRPAIENAKIDSLRQNRSAQRLEQEYRSRPTYDPNDPVEQSDPNSLTNRARQMRMSFGKKDAKTKAGFTFGYQRYEYDANGQPHPILEDALKRPVDVKLDDGTTVQMTGEQYGNYRTQRERNDAIAKSQQFNQQKYEESRGLADQDYENKRQTIATRNQGRLAQITTLQTKRDELEGKANSTDSPKQQTAYQEEADKLTREIEKVKSEVEYEPPARASAPATSAPARSSGAPKSGVTQSGASRYP